MKVSFADGTVVQGRGLMKEIVSIKDDETPTWALYLDEEWQIQPVTWPYQLVSWPDGQAPSDDDELFEATVGAWNRAKSGDLIEIGCYGGTGRTGAVIACIALLAGVPVDEAPEWTRRNYHRWAIENHEDVITRFAHWRIRRTSSSSQAS